MSSSSDPAAADGRDPYEVIVSLVRRQADLAPASSAEADAAFKNIAEVTLKLFAEYVQQHGRPPLADDHQLTATDAAVVSSHLLRATDVALFELAMWQSWSGAEIGAMNPAFGPGRHASD